MVGCDNPSCPYKWFHLPCLKLTALSRSKKWFCPECQWFKVIKEEGKVRERKLNTDSEL